MGNNNKDKKKRDREEKPDLYSADIGNAGIKKNKKKQQQQQQQQHQQQTTRQPSDSKTLAGTLALTREELQRRKERQSRFGGGTTSVSSDPSNSALRSDRGGYSTSKPGTSAGSSSSSTTNSSTTSTGDQFIGENQNLEKPYLRLTTFPRKEDVRPLSVLKRSLAHIKARYKESEDMFPWCNNQLKSVRQDITVQSIRNKFVLQVYETHARILLEHGDLNEFNQCNTMIRSLREGMLVDDSLFQDASPKSKQKKKKKRCKPLEQTPEAADEFGAYAILYAIVQRSWMSLKMELMRIQPILRQTSSNGSCRHALSVMQAVLNNDYRTFFTLYDQAPHMSVYLMDFMLKRVRVTAYECIVASYRPTIGVDHIQEWLGLLDAEETRSFLQERGAVFVEDAGRSSETQLDCKACFAKIAT